MTWSKIKRWVPLAVVLALLAVAYVLTAGRGVKLSDILRRLEAARGEERAEVAAAHEAHAAEVQRVETEYRETIAQLGTEQRKEAETLRSDPKKLAKFLARTGAKLLVLLCLGASTARAQDVECSPGFPTRCSVALEAAEPAPFAGQLLTPDLAILLGQTADGCAANVRAETARVQGLAAAERTRDERVHAAELRGERAKADTYRDLLDESEAWYRQPLFVSGTTALGLTVIVLLVVLLPRAP